MKEILVKSFFSCLREICRMACEREESALVAFWEVTLKLLPYSMTSMNSCALQISFSSMPITLMFCFLSYRIFSSARWFSRSYSRPQ